MANAAISAVLRQYGSQPAAQAQGGLNHGVYEGAEHRDRETARWRGVFDSPDKAINRVKATADARSVDMVSNDGHTRGVVGLFKNAIVGAQYRLNADPDWFVLSRIDPAFDTTWAEDYQVALETIFNLMGESEECWFDAAGRMTFTGLVRLGMGSFVLSGETLATVEWIRTAGRLFRTAIQLISPTRLRNPNGRADDYYLRRGVQRDANSQPQGYWITTGHPGGLYPNTPGINQSVFVPATKPWGRKQVIHIIDPDQPDQTRGIAEMVSVLKQMRMTKEFSETVLQNAVVNAMYAANIESSLPTEMIASAMGASSNPSEGWRDAYGMFMDMLSKYGDGSENIRVDGVKIPHFFPGTKLNLKTLGTPGGVGQDYEASLHRWIAAGLDVSYEEYSRDYSRLNYSSSKASAALAGRGKAAKKKHVADRMASSILALWIEEYVNAGLLPMPRRWQAAGSGIFYQIMAKEALTQCSWIGAGAGQVDEVKETQAAFARISAGISTWEIECSRLGLDYRKIFAQQVRERALQEAGGLAFSLAPAAVSATSTGDATTAEPPVDATPRGKNG